MFGIDEPAIFPLIGLLAGVLVGASGVGGAALATPLLIFAGVPVAAAIATDAAFCAVIKMLGIGAHRQSLRGALGPIKGMMLAALVGALAGVLALDHLAALSGGETIIRRGLGIALLLAAIVLGLRIARGPGSADGRALLPRPVAIAASGILGFLVGLTSIGAGSLFLPLLLMSVKARFDAIVGLGLALGLVLAITAGAAHLTAGNADPRLLVLLLAGGLPGVLAGARLHKIISPKTLASGTATVIAAVGLRLVVI